MRSRPISRIFIILYSFQQKQPLDGRDIWPVITAGRPSPHEDILINAMPNSGAIRMGSWKRVPRIARFSFSTSQMTPTRKTTSPRKTPRRSSNSALG